MAKQNKKDEAAGTTVTAPETTKAKQKTEKEPKVKKQKPEEKKSDNNEILGGDITPISESLTEELSISGIENTVTTVVGIANEEELAVEKIEEPIAEIKTPTPSAPVKQLSPLEQAQFDAQQAKMVRNKESIDGIARSFEATIEQRPRPMTKPELIEYISRHVYGDIKIIPTFDESVYEEKVYPVYFLTITDDSYSVKIPSDGSAFQLLY